MLNIVGQKKTYLTISGILVGLSVVAMLVFGFREGIDFKGGAILTFKADAGASDIHGVEQMFRADLGLSDARVNYDAGNKNFLARIPHASEQEHQNYNSLLKAKLAGFEELSFQSIGPSVGAELRQRSLIALALVLIGISLYVAFAFRKVYRPVSSLKYGWVTLASLFHDVAIPAGLLAVLGHYGKVEIDGNFIVALLVVMGFSVHDTIVVFDRIRENLLLDRGKSEFGKVINESVNQTLARSINTSLTLILVLLALYFTGPATLSYFVLTLLVGVTTGIYSSIFVASPLLHAWHAATARRAVAR